MRIIVFSDSHGSVSICSTLLKKIAGIDMIIHAGDYASDAEKLNIQFPEIDTRFVRGNCDYINADDEISINIKNIEIFLTHGHKYNVKYDSGYSALKNKINSQKANLAVFGHTHIPYYENTGNFILLNPGSIKYTRTFGIIEIEGSKMRADICDANIWL